jgi:hypothetical protein
MGIKDEVACSRNMIFSVVLDKSSLPKVVPGAAGVGRLPSDRSGCCKMELDRASPLVGENMGGPIVAVQNYDKWSYLYD